MILPDIELVAAEVHQAWIKQKLLVGVLSHRSETGEELVVPYGWLSEEAKELDRATVRTVYEAIDFIGPWTRGVGAIANRAIEELIAACAAHGPMKSAHEGWAVIFEELDELWEEVRKRNRDNERMTKEAIQVAAMAMRFVLDVSGENS